MKSAAKIAAMLLVIAICAEIELLPYVSGAQAVWAWLTAQAE